MELTLVLLTELLLRTLFSRADNLLPVPVCIAKRLSARARPGIDLDLQHNRFQYMDWHIVPGKYLAMSNEAMPSRLACNRDSVESPESARVAWEPRREAEVEREEET